MSDNLNDLRLITFPGAPNLPIFAADENGYFSEFGLHVDHETTTSSPYQIENLVAQNFQIAGTALDNVIAYQEGLGAVELATTPDLFVFMGATQIELTFAVAKDIDSFEHLRGRTLAMDALYTGFAFVLYEMLEKNGLKPGDYQIEPVGATPHRWESVKNGNHAGTLLIEPFSSMARTQGYTILAVSGDVCPHYQGGIFTASRQWAADNPALIEGYIKAYLKGLDWCLDPENYEAAKALLLRRMPAIKPEAADNVMRNVLSEKTGLTPQAEIDYEGFRTVLDLRNRFGPENTGLSEPDAYIDLTYYENAL